MAKYQQQRTHARAAIHGKSGSPNDTGRKIQRISEKRRKRRIYRESYGDSD